MPFKAHYHAKHIHFLAKTLQKYLASNIHILANFRPISSKLCIFSIIDVTNLMTNFIFWKTEYLSMSHWREKDLLQVSDYKRMRNLASWESRVQFPGLLESLPGMHRFLQELKCSYRQPVDMKKLTSAFSNLNYFQTFICILLTSTSARSMLLIVKMMVEGNLLANIM